MVHSRKRDHVRGMHAKSYACRDAIAVHVLLHVLDGDLTTVKDTSRKSSGRVGGLEHLHHAKHELSARPQRAVVLGVMQRVQACPRSHLSEVLGCAGAGAGNDWDGHGTRDRLHKLQVKALQIKRIVGVLPCSKHSMEVQQISP